MDIINGIIAIVPQFNVGINIFDIVILLVIVFYVYEGYSLGFTLAFLDLLSFIISFIAALQFYTNFAGVLIAFFALPIGIANAIAFFIIAVISEIVLTIVFRRLSARIPSFIPFAGIRAFLKDANQLLGILPGLISAFIILAFLLSLIITFPSSPFVKQAVDDSVVASSLVSNTSLFEKQLKKVFGGALDETLNFMTVEPESSKTVQLHFTVVDGTVDAKAEKEMLLLINKERASNGIQSVSLDPALQQVARSHSEDMFRQGYFSHTSLDGRTPFLRMEDAGINYQYAGENLALSPTTGLAMKGLMNSPGHRANILNPNFNKVGIGVIDGGLFGKMYSQEFTD